MLTCPNRMTPGLSRSYEYCQRLARREAGNFYHAFHVLPRVQKRSMCALYAFLRLTDDLVDGAGNGTQKLARLSAWRTALRCALAGEYHHALHPALHDTMVRFGIPAEYLEEVLRGVEMDLEQTTYATFAELYRYCYRVASVVGLSCIRIWGFESDANVEFSAEEAGIAFQLTNILRDLGEDAARGRIYLPQDELVRFGYWPEQLQRGEVNDAFRELMRFEIERARGFYERSSRLGHSLAPAGRAVFQAMSRTYAGILNAIEHNDYDVFTRRARVSRWKKMGHLVAAIPIRWGWI